MTYQAFCVILLKNSESIYFSSDYLRISDTVLISGTSIDNDLVGNIHPFLPDFKNWDVKAIAVFQKNLENNAAQFLKNFVADFSFVKINASNRILAARDHFGVFPLYYYDDASYLIIASDQRLITAVPGLDLSPDIRWMGDFVTQSYENPDSTFYKHIRKLPPSHLLEYEEGLLKISCYWELNIHNPLPEKADEEYISEFAFLLQQAVECRIPDGVNIGSEVSGGIDCTSVAAIAKSYLDKQNRHLFTYSHSSVDNEKHPCEKEAINTFITFLQPHKHTFTPEKITGMRGVMEHAFQLGNGIAHSHYATFSKAIYEKARSDQVSIIFSGNGGDHGVSYRGSGTVIQSHLAVGDFNKAYQELRVLHGSLIKTCLVFVYSWLKVKVNWGSERPVNAKIRKNSLKALEAMKRLYPELKDYCYKESTYSSYFKYVHEHILEKLMQAELYNRCEATTIAASHYGVVYRYPLLDIRLLQYLVSLPPRMLYQNGINRYIFRKTIEQWVPKSLAYQPKPPGNMYGWILEAYKFDYDHQIEYSLIPENEEMRFCLDFWKFRDETTRNGELFKSLL
ncbi:MAG: asparagine synthase-related protein [Bacteroidota bacterium]